MDYSRYLNKPFLVSTFNWSTSDAQWSLLNGVTMPTSFLSNDFLKVPFTHSSLFRCKARVMIQVASTPMHQGILLASAMPLCAVAGGNTGNRLYTNAMLNAPHVFLSASESSSVSLEIPFYANSKLLQTDAQISDTPSYSDAGGNTFANVNIVVFNPLVAPTGGTTSLSVIVHVVFDELEFYAPYTELNWVAQSLEDAQKSFWCCERVKVPDRVASWISCICCSQVTEPNIEFTAQASMSFTSIFSTLFDNIAYGAKKLTGDLIDSGRGLIREYTGLDNGNITVTSNRNYVASRAEINGVDNPTPFNKLDPYHSYDRVTREFNFETSEDEMSLLHIASKPQYLSTVSVATTDPVGKLLFSRPITPQQEVYLSSSGNTPLMTCNMQILSYLTRYWRGTIKVHIQANMTNFHYCKLAIFKSYSPNRRQLIQVPTYDSVQGLMIDFIEFSGGGQVQTIELPFISFLEHLECTRDWAFNALQHGQYYIYLAQPLVFNGSVPLSIDFNIYYSAGEDFQYAGYATDMATIQDATTIGALTRRENQQKLNYDLEKEKAILLSSLSKEPATVARLQQLRVLSKDDRIKYKDELVELEKLNKEFLSYKSQLQRVEEGLRALKDKDVDLKWNAQSDVEVNAVTDVEEPVVTEAFKMEAAQYRPVYSMRDIFRRPVPAEPIYLGASTFSSSIGTLRLPVANLVGQGTLSSTNLANSLAIARRFYLGLDGGVRVKLKIVGSSNAKAFFVPPGQYASTPVGIIESTSPFNPSDATLALRVRSGVTYANKDLSCQVPLQTAANYFLLSDSTQIGTQSSSANNFNSAECELDIYVPNMSPFRFTGDGSGYVSNPATVISPVLDLGNIIVSLKVNPTVSSGVNTFTPVIVQPYVSLGDEARCGYQVKSPTLAYPTILSSSGNLVLQTIFQGQYAGDEGTPANPLTAAPASYIG